MKCRWRFQVHLKKQSRLKTISSPFFAAQQHIQHKAVKEMKWKGTVAAGDHQSNKTGGQVGEEPHKTNRKRKKKSAEDGCAHPYKEKQINISG
ncbi:hypothetical protein L2D08_13875 [Domibacillus sp. PGB-M46]|uniref:hypothetical protein n=1 Tax=Domibacillus sp. PGB-M46 TaxID=2910255 RepID=UPI001F57A19D|nr:hypothetical protein [Domibacillus sp. PGB-M46]MCI2255458.1 hypothetical protein [Domibacillus sp. PGB-M46]